MWCTPAVSFLACTLCYSQPSIISFFTLHLSFFSFSTPTSHRPLLFKHKMLRAFLALPPSLVRSRSRLPPCSARESSPLRYATLTAHTYIHTHTHINISYFHKKLLRMQRVFGEISFVKDCAPLSASLRARVHAALYSNYFLLISPSTQAPSRVRVRPRTRTQCIISLRIFYTLCSMLVYAEPRIKSSSIGTTLCKTIKRTIICQLFAND